MDIFITNVSDANNIQSELLELFGHKKISNPQKRKEHCFSYLMLDRILKNVYKIKNREIEYTKGKPYLKNRDKFFSISHSVEYVVIAFSDNECGVDIEQIKPRDFVSISERMNFQCNNLEEFYYEWTKYEAEYKLGTTCKSINQMKFYDYIITSMSSNIQETFDFYIQNGESFSNL